MSICLWSFKFLLAKPFESHVDSGSTNFVLKMKWSCLELSKKLWELHLQEADNDIFPSIFISLLQIVEWKRKGKRFTNSTKIKSLAQMIYKRDVLQALTHLTLAWKNHYLLIERSLAVHLLRWCLGFQCMRYKWIYAKYE